MNITNKNIEEMISKLENEWDETIEYARDLQDAIDALKNLKDDLTPVTDEEYEKSTKAFTRFLKDVKKESFEGEYEVSDIDYDIISDDLDPDDYDNEDDFIDVIDNEIQRIKESLPSSLHILVSEEENIEDEDELGEYIADKISDETGWCVSTFKYCKL